MIFLFVSILIVYGASNIIVYSSIFEPLRKVLEKIPAINKLVNCMMCISFHIGWIFSVLFTSISHNFISPMCGSITGFIWVDFAFYIIADAMFFSGTTWLIHTAQEYLESFSAKNGF